jgi:hypothetical protein
MQGAHPLRQVFILFYVSIPEVYGFGGLLGSPFGLTCMLAALLPVIVLMSLAMAILLPMIMTIIMVILFTLRFFEMGPAGAAQ